MTAATPAAVRLGLIGVGIGRSRAPELHRLAARLCDIPVTYDLIALESAAPEAFDFALAACGARGYAGVNVTHPFKERAAQVVHSLPEQLRRLGAVNTIRFEGGAPAQGFNTDYTGFKRAFQSGFPQRAPGTVAIVGAGGVGRAIAFALLDLGATELRLFDRDGSRCDRLALALHTRTDVRVAVCASLEEATAGAHGLVNATPLGMHHHPGTPIPAAMIGAQRWAFDAVYTPVQTRFLEDAMAAGLEALSGYELFFYQGVDAFEIFTGLRVDEAGLRDGLAHQPHEPGGPDRPD